MRIRSAVALACLAAGLCSLTSCVVGVGDWAHFSKDFHSNYPLKPGGSLTVDTFNGSVDVSAWDQDTVDISGTKFGPTQEDADNLPVNIDVGATSVSIHVPHANIMHGNEGCRLVIKVPRNTRLDRITTSNAAIHTEDGTGSSRLHTSNGAIEVVDLHGDLEAQTSNGHVQVRGVDGDARLRSSNGHIEAERVTGELDAHTSNAGVRAEITGTGRSVRVDTSNGGVDLTLPPKFSGPVHVDSSNGPITLRIAEGTNARLSAHTSNSSIRTEVEVRAQGEFSKNRLEGVIGSGGPTFDLSTSNGGVSLIRAH